MGIVSSDFFFNDKLQHDDQSLWKMADRKLKAAKGAFDASIDCGITFFDTAEVYGAGVRTKMVHVLSSIP